MTPKFGYSPLSHRLACLTAAATLILILAGGLVTSNDAGLSVPDWPLSFGKVMPRMVGGVFYEHGHRMIATSVGFLTILLALVLSKKESRSWVRKLSWLALGAVIVQGLFGGLTVLLRLPPAVSVIHACLAQAFFCMVVTLAVVTSRWWLTETTTLSWDRPLVKLATGTTAVVYLQLILGAVVRHLGTINGTKAAEFVPWALILHLLGALVVSILILFLAMNLLREKSQGGIAKAAYALVVGLVLQLTLGVAAYVVRMGIASGQSHQEPLALLPTAHVAVGALILATSLGLTLVLSKRSDAESSQVSLQDAGLARGEFQ